MSDEPNTPPPLPPAVAEREWRRRELQRQQRILQLDEQIAAEKARLDRYRAQIDSSQTRMATLERERAELVAMAPEGGTP